MMSITRKNVNKSGDFDGHGWLKNPVKGKKRGYAPRSEKPYNTLLVSNIGEIGGAIVPLETCGMRIGRVKAWGAFKQDIPCRRARGGFSAMQACACLDRSAAIFAAEMPRGTVFFLRKDSISRFPVVKNVILPYALARTCVIINV